MEYTIRLDTLCEGLIKYYHLNNFAVEDVDKMKQIVKVSLFHNENNFNLELLNTTILEYFHFLKANPETISSTENAEKWILQKNLDKELNKDSLNTTVKKIKI